MVFATFKVETSVIVHDVHASVVKFAAFLALLMENVSVQLRQLVQWNSCQLNKPQLFFKPF